jgi:AraC-like DNA-binding protein
MRMLILELQNRIFRKLNELIASNIDNSIYTVEDLAKDLNISRVQLYRK